MLQQQMLRRVSNVRAVTSADLEPWQTFVDSHPGAGAMHHAGWLGVLTDASGVKPHFLIAQDDAGAVTGVMPGYVSKSIITGPHYTTLDGGPLAANEEASLALTTAARELLSQQNLRYVQIRGHAPQENAQGVVQTVHTVTRTGNGRDAVWNSVASNTRRKVRQAAKEPLETAPSDDLSELPAFYTLYAEHMRDLGTPVFDKALLLAMRNRLGRERLRLFMMNYRSVPVGGLLLVAHGSHWTVLYTIVRHQKAPNYANYLLYWHVIEQAAAQGVTVVDWGRSSAGSTVHLFKQKWAGVDEEIPYVFYAQTARKQFGLLQSTREKGPLQRLWSALPPPVCNFVGPLVRRDLPFL